MNNEARTRVESVLQGCGIDKPSVYIRVCVCVKTFHGNLWPRYYLHPPFLRCLIDRFNYAAQRASNGEVKSSISSFDD